MIIDLHTHFYPPEYLKLLEEFDTGLKISKDPLGRKMITDRGARIVTLTEEMTDPEERLKQMDSLGVTMQVLSLTTPNVYIGSEKESLYLAQISNNYFVELRDKFPGRFGCFASIPLNYPALALEELERSINTLKMDGIVLGTNVNGKYLHDEEFQPIFSYIQKLDVPVLLHPMSPAQGKYDFGMAPLVGFVFDTTMTVMSMVFSGLFEKIKGLKMIIPHLGGTIPYLVERFNNGWGAYPECRQNIPLPPVEYLKNLYYDVVSFHEPALQCAIDSFGVKQLVFGTDYPHVIGDIARARDSIYNLKISSEDKEQIFSSNALTIFKNLFRGEKRP